jgi:transcription-repair coupling factor (superfamily II helicase)
MNLDVLKKEYANDPRCFKITDRLGFAQPQHLHLKGLAGSASQFILASVFNNPLSAQLNHLVILRDAEEAAYFHNTLENLTEALNLFYFPSSFKIKKNYSLLNASHVMLRTEALTKLASTSTSLSTNKNLIITYPEALFEKVVLSTTISQNIISIKQGDVLLVDKVIEQFVNYGFERTDFVYEPGQFAIRGGILDIYSFGNEKPYRIELFGNDIDSIRIFDPESQLSERKLLQVNIIPSMDAIAKNEDGEKVSMLQFLQPNTVVWTEDWQFIKEKIELEEEGFSIWQTTFSGVKEQDENVNEHRKNSTENDFTTAQILEDEIKQRHIIEIGSKSYFNKDASTLSFQIKEQPAFNKKFKRIRSKKIPYLFICR